MLARSLISISLPLAEINFQAVQIRVFISNSILITAGTLTYWVGLVGGVVFVSKKGKFVPSTNDGICGEQLKTGQCPTATL